MANLVRNIFKYSRDYLRSSYRLVHNEVNNTKSEAQVQQNDEDLLRRDDIRNLEPVINNGDHSPPIINFFEESTLIKKNKASRTDGPSNKEDLIRELKQDAENLRAELNEKKRTWEQSNAMLENVLTELKSTLDDIKRRETLQASAETRALPLSDLQLHQLMMMVANNEREEKLKRRLNILVVGMMFFDDDVTSIASEFLEKYFDLRDCVVSARASGRTKDILVIQLKSPEVKAEIQRNRSLLKGTGIHIRPDLTEEQSFLHRRLRRIGVEARKLGRVVKIGYTWLEIDHVKYYWCYKTNSLQPTTTRSERYWNS